MKHSRKMLALLLVLAMTLTMLPMPAHADEVKEPESIAAVVEEIAEKTAVSGEEISTDAANKPAQSADSDITAKENASSAADSNTATTEKLAVAEAEDTPVSDPAATSAVTVDPEETAEDAKEEEAPDTDLTGDPEEDINAVDSDEAESAEDSETDTQEETERMESETEAPDAAMFSLRRSAVNAAADCEHENTTFVVDSREDYWYYLHTNEAQHVANYYMGYKCDDCGVMVSQVRDYFAEDHVMNADSVCTLCGYGAGENSCTHSETEVAWDTNHTVTYTPVNSTQHKVEGYQYTYCTSCFERVGESFAAEETQSHALDADGACSLCNYSADCEHNVIWKILDDESITIKKVGYIGDTQHSVSYLKWPCCTLCGLIVGDAEWTPEVIEEHSFSESDWCDVCSFRRNCPHESTHEEMDRSGLPGYRSVSDTQHVMFVYYFDICYGCGKQVGERRAVDTGSYSDHTMDDSGVCTLCGYASDESTGCAHENVITGYAPLYDPPRYEQYNDTQHFVYHIFKKTCLDCGETLSDGEETASLEDHVLDNGKCTYCGYGMGEDYCTHPDTDVMWSSAPMTYTSLNEEQHEVEGCQYHYCTSCYKRICADFPVKEWEDHTFDSAGDCTLCDYRVGCEHKQTMKKLHDTLYESLTKDSHKVTRLYSKVCADEDCGKVLVSVETSYTETETEDHDFDKNTCTLCGYTAADQLRATVTASGLTANKGERISASVSVVGGTGGYQYSWKILKDGSVKAGSSITTDTSYDYLASEEGTYVFQVTVTDSGGNTVTAQSGAITVKHVCQYETITNTELVIQSATHHTVETTTYEECTICHEKINEVMDVDWAEHTPVDANSYGYEAAHPHQKYFICECGSHPYLDGQYETANGTVQEESVCCICHGHSYGAEEETPEGTRQKTCASCGLVTVTHEHDYELVKTTKLIDPDETNHYVETTSTKKCKTCGHEIPWAVVAIEEPHSPKNPDDYKFRDGHPHLRYAVCECGKEFDMQDEYKTANGTMQAPDVCCLCHGHVFGEPTEINSVIWKVICSVCGYEGRIAAPSQEETETTEPNENADEKQELKDYNIDFIKKNALGKNDIYTLFFNDELRAQIEELSEGLASKAYDLIDGDPTAHLALSQAEFYVDTLMKQCADLDTDGDTIKVSTVIFDEMCKAFESICKDLGIYDTVYKVFVERFVTGIYTDGTYNKKDIILTKKQFENQIDQYDFKVLEEAKEGIKIGTYLWKCLKDISVYSAAMIGPASGMIDAAKVQWEDTSAEAALAYLELCTNPALMPSYVMLKNADLAEGIRGSIADKVLANPMLKLSFETTLYLNDLVFSVNDILKSNHGTYWSLQLVDEMYENLNTAIKKYESNPDDKNYTECMETYSLYITYLVSAYQGVIDTRENYSSTLAGEMMTTYDMQQKNKELNNQYKAILEWYKYDISAAINDFSIEKVIKEIEAEKD